MAVALRYAALSDTGLVRSNNQDSGYAGPRLLVVADGMGGHAGGDIASSLAVGEMAFLDEESHGPDAVLGRLSEAVHAAHRELLARVSEEPALTGMGTTVTALLRTNNRLALAHIGDSRAYVLRDGQLSQITRDHTFVQRLVDDGRITQEEAEHHPQRSVLMRVLSDVVDDVEPDLSMREARVGDRYLLCSDGLSSVVSHDTLEVTMDSGADPAQTCEQLVQLALRGGAPDNVTCIVADVVDVSGVSTETVPTVVGAAAARAQPRMRPANTAAQRAAELTAPEPEAAADDEEPSPGRSRLHRLRIGASVLAVATVLALGGLGAYRWSQGQYFVGESEGVVAVYRGLPQNLGPITLSRVTSTAGDVQVADLPVFFRRQVAEGIPADDADAAAGIVARLRQETAACRGTGPATSSTSAPGSTAPGSTAPASPSPSTAATSKAPASPSTSPSGSPSAGTGPTTEDCQEAA